MAIQALLGSVSRSYLTGLASGKALAIASAKGKLGDFNALEVISGSGQKAVLSLPDFVALEKKLKEVSPELQRRFRQDAKKLGEPAKKEIRKAFKAIGARGPLSRRYTDPTKPWATAKRNTSRNYDGFISNIGKKNWSPAYAAISKNSGIDVQYKSRRDNSAMAKIPRGQDGTLSVVRVRVKQGPLIIADIAGRRQTSMYARGAYKTKPYQINLFGRGVIMHPGHRINAENSDRFIENLRRARGKLKPSGSRYAWPTAEKFMPKHARNASALVDATVAELNRRLGSTNV